VIAIVIIEPFSSASRICSGAIAANAARVGARGTPASWQTAQVL
jgi:hypothetical protein